MPRKWTLKIEPWPALAAAFYRMKVLSISKSKSPHGLLIELEHLDKKHAGRRQSIVLPLPCRPGSLTARFLQATGFNVSIGQTITPADTVGATLKVRLEPMPDGHGYQATWFEPIKKESEDEHKPE